MKLKNVKVGQTVKIRKSNEHFYPRNIGEVGLVIEVEPTDYDGDLTVKLQLSDDTDWGNHTDIKLIEDVV